MENKVSLKRPFWWFFAAYAISFGLFYCAYILQDSLRIDFAPLDYTRYFYLQALNFAAPRIAGAVLIPIGRDLGTAYAMKKSWILPLSTLIYSVPYYYFYYFYVTIDSLEAILFGLLNTLFDCVVFYLQSLVIYFAVRWLTRVIAKRKSDAKIYDLLSERSPFDLSRPLSIAVFITVGIKFLVMLIMEIITTVGYLLDFSGSYKIDEIVYILVSYVILLAELIATQYFIFFAKNRIEQKNNITEAEKA